MRQPSDREILARLIPGDDFFSHRCYRCLHRAAAFYLRGKPVSVCPECVQERIASLDLELGGLPEDIEVFRWEAEREVAFQDRKEEEALTVDWNYLLKCHRCGHLAEWYEVRFPRADPDTGTCPPYCYACTLVCWEEDRCRGENHAGSQAGARETGSGHGSGSVHDSAAESPLLLRVAEWVVDKLMGFAM